ncbi:hypothetical protein FJZ36_01940 [Candidatus Poribacteria bacterium]|nr:hypothetical protein [Candidatus Poribacteria bacterium]
MGSMLRCDRVAAVVLLLALALPAFCQVGEDADVSMRPEGLIAYVEQRPKPTRDGIAAFFGIAKFLRTSNIYDQFSFDVFTMRSDGTDRRQLTTDGMNRNPVWSRDGKWLAYINGPQQIQSLFVVRADGTGRRPLLDREVAIRAFWWSLDSTRLLVAVASRRGGVELEGRVIQVETGDVSRLSNSDWMRGWNHWEPGKTEVVNPRTRLLDALAGVEFPYWSPDAQFVAFVRDGSLALAHVETVSSSGQWFLFNNEPPADGIFDWSWDGQSLLFQIAGSPAIATLADGKWGDIIPITTRRAQAASINDTGSRVAFTTVPPGQRNAEIFVVDRTGDNETRLTHSIVNHLDLHWQPVTTTPIGAAQGE